MIKAPGRGSPGQGSPSRSILMLGGPKTGRPMLGFMGSQTGVLGLSNGKFLVQGLGDTSLEDHSFSSTSF